MATASRGLSPKLYKGLSKKRMAKGGGNFNRLNLKQGESVVVQFLEPISEFLEYEIHTFRDGNRWQYVPCAGDDCPLCADDDPEVSKTSYRFCCNVYSFKEKKVLILEGPKDLAGRIAHRYEKRKQSWTKRTWEVSKFATTPVSYDVESADDRPVRTEGLERHDLEKYVSDAMTAYFGNDMPTADSKKKGPSSLDDWDDEEDDEAEFDDEDAITEDELLAMGPEALKAAAAEVGIKVSKVTNENRRKVISAILRKQ